MPAMDMHQTSVNDVHLASRDCVESVTTQQHETVQSLYVLDTHVTESAMSSHAGEVDTKPPQEQSPPPERSSSSVAGSQISRGSSCEAATPKGQTSDCENGGEHDQGDGKLG